MTGEEFKAWKREMELSTNEMAEIFGFAASTVKSYLAGESPVPVAVQIACNAMRENRAYLVRPRAAGRPRRKPVAA